MLLNCGVGEDSLESLGLQPVHSKGDQSWVFIGKTVAKAETPVLWPPHVKSWSIGKDSDAGRDWGQEKKGMTEDEMAGWHHQLVGHEFGWTPGVGDGQGGLACCDSWSLKESDMTEQLNWTEIWDGRGQRSLACCIRVGHDLVTKQQYILSSKVFGKMKPIIWGLRQGGLGWGKQ